MIKDFRNVEIYSFEIEEITRKLRFNNAYNRLVKSRVYGQSIWIRNKIKIPICQRTF